MQIFKSLMAVLLVFSLAGGCAVTQQADPPALANTARDQIGQLAIRGPTRPTVALTSGLDGKGKAARKTAVAAGASWLNGSFEAAGQSDEGAILVAMFGLVTTPLVAAGGAMYGAMAADTQEAIAEGNDVLEQALDFAPAQLQHALAIQFSGSAPVTYQFVESDRTDSELLALGFDSVLDIEMDRIASHPSENDFHVYFETVNRARLGNLSTGQILATRSYRRQLAPKAVSNWAGNEADDLASGLDQSFADIAENLTHELFLAPAIRVKGLEPVSANRFRVGTIPGARPLFVWSALDGGKTAPSGNVEYEVLLAQKAGGKPRRFRTRAMRYVPPENLEECRAYDWQVRAHYDSFGIATTSDWSPIYRFKTSCGR